MDEFIRALKNKEIIIYCISAKDEYKALKLSLDEKELKPRYYVDGTPIIVMRVEDRLPQDIREMIDK